MENMKKAKEKKKLYENKLIAKKEEEFKKQALKNNENIKDAFVNLANNAVEIKDKIECDLIYEKKYFIVRGETKNIKEEFKNLKGNWNPTFKGWTFKLKAIDDVKDLLEKHNFLINEKYSDEIKNTNNAVFHNTKLIVNSKKKTLENKNTNNAVFHNTKLIVNSENKIIEKVEPKVNKKEVKEKNEVPKLTKTQKKRIQRKAAASKKKTAAKKKERGLFGQFYNFIVDDLSKI